MIRTATKADAPQIRRIYRPAVADGITSFETSVPDVDEMGCRITRTLEKYPWLVDEESGVVRGYAYATALRERAAYQWSVEVSVYVDGDCRKKGCGRSLYRQLFHVLNQLGYCSTYAGVALPNIASQTFHQSLGFVRVGVFPRVGYKFGQWHDVGWWYRALREDPPAELAPPLLFPNWSAKNA